jgi:hypothetical protein
MIREARAAKKRIMEDRSRMESHGQWTTNLSRKVVVRAVVVSIPLEVDEENPWLL